MSWYVSGISLWPIVLAGTTAMIAIDGASLLTTESQTPTVTPSVAVLSKLVADSDFPLFGLFFKL